MGKNVFLLWNMHLNGTQKTGNPGKTHRGIDSLHIHVTSTDRCFILSHIGITGCVSKLKSCHGCEGRLRRAYEGKCERENTKNLVHPVLLFVSRPCPTRAS